MSMLERISAQLLVIEQQLKNELNRAQAGLAIREQFVSDETESNKYDAEDPLSQWFQTDSLPAQTIEQQWEVQSEPPDPIDSIGLCVTSLHHSIQRLSVLSEITNEVKGKYTLGDVVDTTLDAVNRRTILSFSVLILGEKELGPYHYHGMRGEAAPWKYLLNECPFPLSGSMAQAILRRRQADEPDYLLFPDLTVSQPTRDEFPWLPGSGSLLFIPLRFAQHTIGALMLGTSAANGFADQTICKDLYDICSISAEAIRTAQMYQEVTSNAEKLVNAQLLTREIASAKNHQTLMTILTDRISEITDHVQVRVYIEPTLHHLGEDRFARNFLPNIETKLQLMPSDSSFAEVASTKPIRMQPEDVPPHVLAELLGWAIDAGQPLFYDPKTQQNSNQHPLYNESGAAMIVPIADLQQSYGVLHLLSTDPQLRFEESDMVVFRTIANSAATAFAKFQILREKQNSLLSALHPLMDVVETRFPALGGHSKRTSHNATLLAKSLGLSDECCMQIRVVTSFHEIGMASIPDAELEMILRPDAQLAPLTTIHTLQATYSILARAEINPKFTQLLQQAIIEWPVEPANLDSDSPIQDENSALFLSADLGNYTAQPSSMMEETQELDSVFQDNTHQNHRMFEEPKGLDDAAEHDAIAHDDAGTYYPGLDAINPMSFSHRDGSHGDDGAPKIEGPGSFIDQWQQKGADVQIILLCHALDEFLIHATSGDDFDLASIFLREALHDDFDPEITGSLLSLVEQELVLLP